MFTAIIMLFVNGTPIDVDVIGTADTMSHCVEASKAVLPSAQVQLDKDTQIVIKCAPSDKLPSNMREFEELPIAASGFGTATSL